MHHDCMLFSNHIQFHRDKCEVGRELNLFTSVLVPSEYKEVRKGSTVQFSSVQSLSCVWLFATPWTWTTPGVYPNSCPLSRWCHPTISSSVIPFSSCPKSFPASGSFQVSQFFASGGQSIGASASTSALPINTQDWSPLGWTCWISLQFKRLSRVFSNNTVQKHQFFST